VPAGVLVSCVGGRLAIGLRPAHPDPTSASKNKLVEPKYSILRRFRASAERVRRPLAFRARRGGTELRRALPGLVWLWNEFFKERPL